MKEEGKFAVRGWLPIIIPVLLTVAQLIRHFDFESKLLKSILGAAILIGIAIAIPRFMRLRALMQTKRDEIAPSLTENDFALFLRSFDGERRTRISSPYCGWVALWQHTLPISLGEFVGVSLDGVCEVIEIGGEVKIGASRIIVSREKWRAEFDRLCWGASAIIVTPTLHSDNIRQRGLSTMWEVNRLVQNGLISKMVLFMPPVNMKGRRFFRNAWNEAREHLATLGVRIPVYSNCGGVFNVIQTGQGFDAQEICVPPHRVFKYRSKTIGERLEFAAARSKRRVK